MSALLTASREVIGQGKLNILKRFPVKLAQYRRVAT